MNPTYCEMKFLKGEQFLRFVEKFGNEKNEIDFKYALSLRRRTYKENFGICFGSDNSCQISGTHEIAKDEKQLAQALNAFKKYGEQAGKVIAGQSSFCFGDEFVI